MIHGEVRVQPDSPAVIDRRNLTNTAGAWFSSCERYRYLLWRRWGAGPACNFVMLNPSTADEVENDPTVERCERRAREWRYAGLYVTNIFAWRSTDPAYLKAALDPVGPENDTVLIDTAKASKLVICAWGSHGKLVGRSKIVRAILSGIPLQALRISPKTGEPWHPLYLPYSLKPIPFGDSQEVESATR